MVFDREHVLQRDGDTEERLLREVRTGGDGLVRCVRLSECVRRVVADEGLDVAVRAGDLVEARLHGVTGGDLAPGEARGEFGDGETVKHFL